MAGGATPTPAPARAGAAAGTDGGAASPYPTDGGFADAYRRPIKRSVTIAGHETSVALEPIFWAAIDAAAASERLPLNALIARIDAARIAVATPPNLTSAIRVWLFARAQQRDEEAVASGRGEDA